MKRSLMALALLAALPLSAQAAEGLSYNFIEADYLRIDIEDADGLDPEGYGLKGSFAFGDKFYGFGSYMAASDDIGGFELEVDQSQLGVGYRHPMNDKADFITELSWINQSVDADGIDETDANGGKLSF